MKIFAKTGWVAKFLGAQVLGVGVLKEGRYGTTRTES